MTLPSQVNLVEVGPRDGLQNEATFVATRDKLLLIDALVAAGCRMVEATSFVSPDKIPQTCDAEQVLAGIKRQAGVGYPVLVPNAAGYARARHLSPTHIAIFGSASETFSQKNINCSQVESLVRFAEVCRLAKEDGIAVRGYVSCAVSCPYEGAIEPAQVAAYASQLAALGCYEISLADTTGVATPKQILRLLDAVTQVLPSGVLALHLHNTYGQALANIYAALNAGITTFDTAIAGLGGCPYAPGAAGNVATEDVVYLLDGLGITTGIRLDKLTSAAQFICANIGKLPESHVSRATWRKK